jgi:hypothetical protein
MLMRSREQVRASIAAKLAAGDADGLVLTNTILFELLLPVSEEMLMLLKHREDREQRERRAAQEGEKV